MCHLETDNRLYQTLKLPQEIMSTKMNEPIKINYSPTRYQVNYRKSQNEIKIDGTKIKILPHKSL